jgi:hypothetical protein
MRRPAMTEPLLTNLKVLGECWSGTVTGLVWGQWLLLDTGLRATEKVLKAASPAAADDPADATQRLIQRASERIRRGLAPPREIYQVPYRDRIDWGQFPDWARPSDPEAFEGSAHEG